MQFSYYRLIYLNLILLILFLTNQFVLFFIFLFFKLPYLLNMESDVEYQFDFIYCSFDDIDARYLENDIDNEYYYILGHMEFYLCNNCRFFFDVLGGETTLDFIDFIDFTIYELNDDIYNNINRNYKNIYNNKIKYMNIKTSTNMYNYKIYQLIENSISDNYYNNQIKYLRNILNKKDNKEKEKVDNKKIKKIIKDNYLTKITTNKNIMKQQIFMYDDKIFDKKKEQQRSKILALLKNFF